MRIARIYPNSDVGNTDELRKYLDCGAESMDTDVHEYWYGKRTVYPNLSRMAKDYLAVLASSASSERVFSTAKHLIGLNRMCLNPQTMEANICLRSWIRAGFITAESMLEKVSPASPEGLEDEESSDILQTAIEDSGIFEDLNELQNYTPRSPYVEIEIEFDFDE